MTRISARVKEFQVVFSSSFVDSDCKQAICEQKSGNFKTRIRNKGEERLLLQNAGLNCPTNILKTKILIRMGLAVFPILEDE